MAHFFMMMAWFFTVATFSKFMNFAWFSRKDTNFLQVQSEHCKRLCNIIPSLERFLKDLEASPKTKVLNRNQCIHLFGKLILAMKGIHKMLSSATGDLKFQSIFEELCFLQKKVEIVGNNCFEQDQWSHSIVFQLQNKETFRELLLDMKCCYDTARDIYLFHHPSPPNDIPPIQFDAAIHEQVLEDAKELKNKLEFIVQQEISQHYEIAQHLLLRLRNLDRVDGGDLNALEILHDFKAPKLIQKIGKGVYKSNWFGLPCATKVLEGDPEFLVASHKEAGILAGLSHPNLVQFFGCGIIQKVDEIPKEEEIGGMHWVMHLKNSSLFQILKSLVQFFGFGTIERLDENLEEDDTSEMHLVMELMDSNLSSILKKAKGPIPYHLAIDIMHQIAKGVYYLHDMQVAHLDLKPDNVLSSPIPMEDLDAHRIFKVMDYGTCQLEVLSNPENPKTSEYTIGTQGYMSPEVIKENKAPLHPFRADVWSFAMICSEILSKKVPYDGLNFKDFCNQISRTSGSEGKILRPDLPNNFEELTNLIQECWSQDPLQRPTFSNICERLTSLKKSFLKRTYSCEMVPKFGLPCTLGDSKPIVDHVCKVEEKLAPKKEVFVDLDHQLSKAKELLKLNYIGIVGMGGIGKTTLAKAIFDDVAVTSSYQASCFVAQCKNYLNLYEILYEILSKILPKLEDDQKPKNLEDAQMMMKEFLLQNKVLLILDDVKDEAQVRDIVAPKIVQASKGTTIIITTRKWNTIKSFVDIEGRLDVELLEEKAATTLFTTHLSWGVGPLSPDFEDFCKYVVKACNGLPLSLKVMGSFLHKKERLRSWERALQRIAKGKNLDGDEELWNTLKISYDGLNNGVEKGMFLDMACFFCRDVYPSGISKETILFMWSKDGVLPMDELERLIDMSLLKVNKDGGILEMHDQLRDMGRKIAGGSRIWKASMIPEGGFTSKDIEVLLGISWQGTKVQYDFDNQLDQVGSCGQGIMFTHDYGFDFQKLRILMLVTTLGTPEGHVDNLDFLLRLASQCSQLETIIIGNSRNLIRSLPMHTSLTLEDGISNLCTAHASLKILDLIGLGFLTHLPNKFASIHTLLRLNLSSCFRLMALPNEVGNLSSLITLNLSDCSSLVTLPKEVGKLSLLTTLDLRGCSSLVALPKEVGNLFLLTTLDLRGCSSLVTLPNEVGNLSSLTTLNLTSCSSLVALPKEVGNLSSLTTLHLWSCLSLVELPKEVGNLSSLTTLNLSGCSSLMELPKEVGNLSFLTTLDLWGCSTLVALPKEVGNFFLLTTLNLTSCSSLVELPKEVGKLSLLTTLDLRHCSSLVTLPKEVGNLSLLTTLDLWDCSSLVTLPKEVGNLSFLTTLHLWSCSSLVELPKEVGNLSLLTTLNLSSCSSLVELPKEVGNLSLLTTLDLRGCSSLVVLPKEVGNLSSLSTLHLWSCSSLVALPKEVGNLSLLTILNLSNCSILVELPKEVGSLSSLTTLNLSGCSSLVGLPKELGNLSSLTTLNLWSCSSLVELPKEVGNLSLLTTLDLWGCSSLVALPKEVGNLSLLTTLDLWGCSSLVALPQGVGNLSLLTTLDLSGCSSLVTLPKEVGNLPSLTILNLKECSSLAALPEEVEKLNHLAKLFLDGCVSLNSLPKNLGWIHSLQILSWNRCPNLESYMLVEMSAPTSLASLDGKFFCLEGNNHDGVTCDGCKMSPIVGPRLKAKATFKLDYDLCFKCFTKWKLLLENSSQ